MLFFGCNRNVEKFQSFILAVDSYIVNEKVSLFSSNLFHLHVGHIDSFRSITSKIHFGGNLGL